MTDRLVLERRLERLRAARADAAASSAGMPSSAFPSGDTDARGADAARPPLLRRPVAPGSVPPRRRGLLAYRLATRLGAEIVRAGDCLVVRVDGGSAPLPIDRERLATLPGQPPPDVPLLCLDTETTGLGTAAGTLAFLVGLGWWEGDAFRQVQLLLPDHADEPALLAAVMAVVPAGAWLVTYNGRTFDWPLLETRFRLRRHAPPDLGGHLDLLPVVRRLFRHRLPDARLRTVERAVLGITRYGDIDGSLIPGRYLEALRLGDPEGLVDVIRHNDLDVLALARLLVHLETGLADATVRRSAHPGDLAGLGRSYRRAGRLEEALDCLQAAIAAMPARRAGLEPLTPRPWEPDEEAADGTPWWSPRARPDIGGPPVTRPLLDPPRLGAAWTEERLLVERARVLRRLGRTEEAAETWSSLMSGPGRLAAVAAIELAKLQEHRLRDRAGALASLRVAWRILDRRRRLGLPEPALEADLVRRGARLRRAFGDAPRSTSGTLTA